MSAHQEILPTGHHSTQPQKMSDPHTGWLAGWRKAREDFDAASLLPGGGNGDTPAEEEAYGRSDALAQQIVETKALTVEGIAAQMDYFVADFGDTYWDTCDLERKAIKAMHEGLQGLVGQRADETNNRRIIRELAEDIQASTFRIQGFAQAIRAVRDEIDELRTNSPVSLAVSALLHAIENETERLSYFVEKIDNNTMPALRAV